MAKVKLKKTVKKTAAKKTPASKKSVNKSEAIRQHMAKHPNDGPNAVAAALNKAGLDVTAAFVSTIKSMDRKRLALAGGAKASAVASVASTASAAPRSSASDDIQVTEVLRAKKLAAEFGGVDRARAALDALSKIVD